MADTEKTLKLISVHDVRLTEHCKEIPLSEISTKGTQGLIDQMLSVADRPATNSQSVGLAAPQVGILKRIILVNLHPEVKSSSFVAFINPIVTWRSEETEMGFEGCYSTPNELLGFIERSKEVMLSAYDRNGQKVEKKYSGLSARILQHEIDHLDGIRFPDRHGKKDRLYWVTNEQIPLFIKLKEKWPVCSYELWIAMKENKPFTPPFVDKKLLDEKPL